MPPPTAAQVAADKAAIDVAIQALCRAAKVKVTLPSANPDPAKGPFAHLRAALRVLPAARLTKRFSSWPGGWFDRLARNDTPPGADVAKRRWKGQSATEKTVLASGTGVVMTPHGDQVLWLSPAGPGAAVFVLGPSSLTQLGLTVRDFVEREVARLLGQPVTGLTTALPAGAKAFAQQRRDLARLRQTQPPARVVQANLVTGKMLEGFPDAAALLSALSQATDTGLECFYGFADAENADDKTLREHPWLVGRSVAQTRGRLKLPRGLTGPLFLVARGGLARATLFAGDTRLASTTDFLKLTARHLAAATHLVAERDD